MANLLTERSNKEFFINNDICLIKNLSAKLFDYIKISSYIKSRKYFEKDKRKDDYLMVL